VSPLLYRVTSFSSNYHLYCSTARNRTLHYSPLFAAQTPILGRARILRPPSANLDVGNAPMCVISRNQGTVTTRLTCSVVGHASPVPLEYATLSLPIMTDTRRAALRGQLPRSWPECTILRRPNGRSFATPRQPRINQPRRPGDRRRRQRSRAISANIRWMRTQKVTTQEFASLSWMIDDLRPHLWGV